MKILIINGSPRTGGFTASILHSIERSLKDREAEVEYYDLSRLKMSQCQGCCACYATGHCHIKDDAEELSEKIKTADGLVIGSPTYASNVSGFLKTFIDRGHFVIEQLLNNKFCVTVATGENYGNKDTAKVLKNLVIYSGGRLAKTVTLKAPFNGYDKGKAEKASENAAKSLYSAISKKKKYPFQRVFHRVIFNVGIKPFVKRKGASYRGVTEKWKELGIL